MINGCKTAPGVADPPITAGIVDGFGVAVVICVGAGVANPADVGVGVGCGVVGVCVGAGVTDGVEGCVVPVGVEGVFPIPAGRPNAIF